jgi:hypothetical protein
VAGGMREGAGRPRRRAVSDQCVSLDVRELVKQAVFAIPRRGTLRWWDSSHRAVAELIYQSSSHGMSVSYWLAGRRISQDLEIRAFACNFGGYRYFFECPLCSQLASLLYMRVPAFGCRRCNDVAYASQFEDHIDRLRRRQYNIDRRLGPNLTRPKGMHQSTYDRLKDASFAFLVAAEDAIENECDRRGVASD